MKIYELLYQEIMASLALPKIEGEVECESPLRSFKKIHFTLIELLLILFFFNRTLTYSWWHPFLQCFKQVVK